MLVALDFKGTMINVKKIVAQANPRQRGFHVKTQEYKFRIHTSALSYFCWVNQFLKAAWWLGFKKKT